VNLDAKRRKQIRILYDASVLKKMVLCFGAIYDCAAIGEGIDEKEAKKVPPVLVLIILSFSNPLIFPYTFYACFFINDPSLFLSFVSTITVFFLVKAPIIFSFSFSYNPLASDPSHLFSFVIRESFFLAKVLLILSFFSNLLTFITSTMALSLLVLFLFSRSLTHFTFYSFIFHTSFLSPSSSLVENRSFGVTGSFLLLACYYRLIFYGSTSHCSFSSSSVLVLLLFSLVIL
jgi:hypothetical protein